MGLEELNANAKLIASAPELLEQLKKVIDAFMDGSINRDHILTSQDLIKQATE